MKNHHIAMLLPAVVLLGLTGCSILRPPQTVATKNVYNTQELLVRHVTIRPSAEVTSIPSGKSPVVSTVAANTQVNTQANAAAQITIIPSAATVPATLTAHPVQEKMIAKPIQKLVTITKKTPVIKTTPKQTPAPKKPAAMEVTSKKFVAKKTRPKKIKPQENTTPIKISSLDGLNPNVFAMAKKAYLHAEKDHHAKKPILTVVDFTLPSNKKRLWIFSIKDIHHPRVLYKGFTTHGKRSGMLYATRFSNRNGSLESSLGTYETMNHPYTSHHAHELALKGLEKGINSNALMRGVIIHSAWYASPRFVKQYHRAGRSWGCFAINPVDSKYVVNLIKGGSVLFAYAKRELHDPYVGTRS